MSEQPELTTRRLVLRPIAREDAATVAELAGRDFQVVRWLTGGSWPYEKGDAEGFVEEVLASDPLRQEAVFAVTLGGVMIGCVGIDAPGDVEELDDCPSLGYWLGTPFQGFGYATEACRAVLDWVFEAWDCDCIGGRIHQENAASENVLRKLGFEFFGETERFAPPLNSTVTCVVMRLQREDFRKGEARS